MLVVTGAAGFIGSHLAAVLASMGYELWLVDHPLTPAKAKLQSCSASAFHAS